MAIGIEKFRDIYTRACLDLRIEPNYGILDTLRGSLYNVNKHLNLSSHHLGAKTSYALADALAVDTHFISLDLGDSFLGDDGCSQICNALKKNISLTSIDLRGNNIKNEGGKSIAELLVANISITILGLEWNSIGLWDLGIKALSESLMMNNTLKELDLRNNRIGPQGIVDIAHALKKNNTLTHLDLRWNSAGVIGGKALADAVKNNFALSHLDVSGNDIPDDMVSAIEGAILRNRENNLLREQLHLRTSQLEEDLTKVNFEHTQMLEILNGTIKKKENEMKYQKEALFTQTEELNSKILEERKSFMEVQAQYFSESRLRSVAELRVKELEDSIMRSREDITILTSKLQEDANWQREVENSVCFSKLQQFLNKQKELEQIIHEEKQKHLELESKLLQADNKHLELQLELERAKDMINHEKLRVKSLEGLKIRFKFELNSKERLSTERETLQVTHESNVNQLKHEWESKLVSLQSKLKNSEVARIQFEEEIERKKNELSMEKQKAADRERAIKEEERKNTRIVEDRITTIQQAKDELKKLCDQQQRELADFIRLKESSTKEQQNEIKREREQRLALESELMRLKIEHEALIKEKEHLASQLKLSQKRESETTEDLTKHKSKLKSTEESLREKEQKILKMKQDEEQRILSLEGVMSNYVKMTFAELKKSK